MVLGQLYRPRGLALETAQVVLEVQDPYACNVASGCSNGCLYCYVPRWSYRYVPKLARVNRDNLEVRLPKKPPAELVKHQLERYYKFHWGVQGVFLCFLTDPFLPQCRTATQDLIDLLLKQQTKVATLSKLGIQTYHAVRHGMTVVSLDNNFWKEFEPRTTAPHLRVSVLNLAKQLGDYVWISMEPYPPSAIYKQRIEDLLEELNFVDLIIFGMWNYDKRARTEQARIEYAENIQVLTDFCKSNDIRLHVKSDTLKFIKGEDAKRQ